MADDDALRYMRQIMVRDFGGTGQAALKSAHIAVIGMGGIGSPVALYLAAAGVGRLTLFDDDHVELSNLQRQVLFTTEDLGANKAAQAKTRLAALNPNIVIESAGRFDAATNIAADLWIDGTDRLSTRRMINDRAGVLEARVLAASLAQWEGQIAFRDVKSTPGCLACVTGEAGDAAVPNCAEAGIIGPVAGIIGTIAALEAIKIIANIRPMAPGSILLVDGLYREMRVIKTTARPDCPVCGRD